MEEDEVLAKITRLLERGCTMLASHHDCGAPLFRCQGDVVCPVCSFEDESISSKRRPASEPVSGKDEIRPDPGREQLLQRQEKPSHPGIKKDRSAEIVRPDRSAERGQPDQPSKSTQSQRSGEGYPSVQDEIQFHSVENDLRSALLLRLHELTASLRAEQDLDKLKRLLECLEALLRVLKSLPE